MSFQLDLTSPGIGAEQVGDEDNQSVANLPLLDLCVMNPPFVRSVGGNLLFGSMPEGQRKEMQGELARRVRTENLPASSTAGLGSVFAAVADRHVKDGGRLALVLPAAVTTGIAWEKTRDLIKAKSDRRYLSSRRVFRRHLFCGRRYEATVWRPIHEAQEIKTPSMTWCKAPGFKPL